MSRTLEEFLASMRAQGREFGRQTREAEGRPAMPEPLREGSTTLSEEEKAAGLDQYRIETMSLLGLPLEMPWFAFFDRTQKQINSRVR